MVIVNKRNGWLSAFLIVSLVLDGLTALTYIFGGGALDLPGWARPVLAVICLFNVACVLSLFQWKKWGFWGLCVSTLVTLVINISLGVSIGLSISALLGPTILFGLLQIGKGNKAWLQLS